MTGLGQIKGQNAAFLHFWRSCQLDGLQRAQIQSAIKCLREGYCVSTKTILKKFKVNVRSQKASTKITNKHAVRHMISGPFFT